MDKNNVLKSVCKRVAHLQEMKTTADYRPANQAELGIAMAHADRLGITVEADNVSIDGSGWMIISYVDSNDEEAQMRLAPQQYQIDDDTEDEMEQRALETEETEISVKRKDILERIKEL